jgi:hypothetical protein
MLILVAQQALHSPLVKCRNCVVFSSFWGIVVRNILNGAIIAAALALAPSAHAATVVFDLGNTSGQANAGALSGTDANGRIFTAVNGSTTVRVRATGWSIDSSNIVRDSYLGIFSGAGLGVTSGDDSYNGSLGGGGLHSVDNQTRKDFILLQFDQKVKLDTARFNAIQIAGLNYTDTDASIGYGNTNFAWNAQPALDGQNISALNALIPVAQRYNNAGGASSATRAINPSNFAGNLWLVSASLATNFGGDSKIDAFKLNTLKATTVGVVPEPATWAMMIAGFGFVGAAMRRRRRIAAAA